MKKSLFLCVFACFVLTRPVLAKEITCEEAAREGLITTAEAIEKCGIHYYKDVCYYIIEDKAITCNKCPSGYSGTCTSDGDCSKCYKTCTEPCDPDLEKLGCPEEYYPCNEFAVNKNTTCDTGIEYYDDPGTCIPSGKCQCTLDIPGPYSYCPKGYRDCEIIYNRDKSGPEEVCCKRLTGGTYVRDKEGDAVQCMEDHYCPSGTEIFFGETGGMIKCPDGTSGPGSSKVTECYIPNATPFSDTTGGGKYTFDCYYK